MQLSRMNFIEKNKKTFSISTRTRKLELLRLKFDTLTTALRNLIIILSFWSILLETSHPLYDPFFLLIPLEQPLILLNFGYFYKGNSPTASMSQLTSILRNLFPINFIRLHERIDSARELCVESYELTQTVIESKKSESAQRMSHDSNYTKVT